MHFYEWAGVCGSFASLAGVIVGVVGFVHTVRQLRRTANAAEATEEALSLANERIMTNHLIVLLPQFSSIEGDLDFAIATDNREAAIRALVEYSHVAYQVIALLESSATRTESDLIAELRASAGLASTSKARLVTRPTESLDETVDPVSRQIASLAARCAGLSSTFRVQVA